MKMRALRRFNGQYEGHVERGCEFEARDSDRAHELAGLGVAEILEDPDNPESDEPGAAPSTSETQPAPASSLHPASPPAENASSGGSFSVGPSSASPTATDLSKAKLPPSTPQTQPGGKSTKKRSNERTAKASDGARTAKPAGTLTSNGSNPSEPPDSLGSQTASAPVSSATAVPKAST